MPCSDVDNASGYYTADDEEGVLVMACSFRSIDRLSACGKFRSCRRPCETVPPCIVYCGDIIASEDFNLYIEEDIWR